MPAPGTQHPGTPAPGTQHPGTPAPWAWYTWWPLGSTRGQGEQEGHLHRGPDRPSTSAGKVEPRNPAGPRSPWGPG